MKTDRSSLPVGVARAGLLPTPGSDFAAEIAAGFALHMDVYRKKAFGIDEDQDGSERPMSRPGATFRHSDAAGCALQQSYKIQRLPATDPPTIPDLMNMFWGTVIHEHADHALVAAGWAPWDVEVPTGWDVAIVDGKPLFVPMSTPAENGLDRRPFSAGTLDGRHRYDLEHDLHGDEAGAVEWLRVVENKSQADYAYRLHTGLKGQAEGPAWSAIVQGALGAEAEGADELVVLDIAKNVISKMDRAKFGLPELERILAPFHFQRDTQIEIPTDDPEVLKTATFPQIARRELRRVYRINELILTNQAVPRVIDDPEVPTTARIVEPNGPKNKGIWEVRTRAGQVVQQGQYWGCGYCWHRTRCTEQLEAEKAAAEAAVAVPA